MSLAGALLLAASARANDAGDAVIPGASLSADLSRIETMTPEQKVAYADASNHEIRADLDQLARLLQVAQQSGDQSSMACRTESVRLVGGVVGPAEQAEKEARADLEAGETGSADRELREIAVVLSKTRQLLAQSASCSTAEVRALGDTRVDWRTLLTPETPLPAQSAPVESKPPRRASGGG